MSWDETWYRMNEVLTQAVAPATTAAAA
jgi:hypothetical protein